MSIAYVDTSCLVAIAAGEREAKSTAKRLSSFERLVSSNLLEAELRSVFRREEIDADPAPLLAGISWIFPDRTLTPELDRILERGHARGADLWHLACALFVAGGAPRDLTFITLDLPQRKLASAVGFAVA